MSQSVAISWLESLANSASAYGLGVLMNIWVLPVFNLHPSISDSLWIALVFFVVSVLRNMAWRRFFATHGEEV